MNFTYSKKKRASLRRKSATNHDYDYTNSSRARRVQRYTGLFWELGIKIMGVPILRILFFAAKSKQHVLRSCEEDPEVIVVHFPVTQVLVILRRPCKNG